MDRCSESLNRDGTVGKGAESSSSSSTGSISTWPKLLPRLRPSLVLGLDRCTGGGDADGGDNCGGNRVGGDGGLS